MDSRKPDYRDQPRKNSNSTIGSPEQNPPNYKWAGLGYWFVSYGALIIGGLFQEGSIGFKELYQLSSLSVLTIPFFVIYSVVFDVLVTEYDYPRHNEAQLETFRQFLERGKKEAVSYLTVISALLFVVVSLVSQDVAALTQRYWYVLLYLVLYYPYMLWLLRKQRKRDINALRKVLVDSHIRHEIFLPVLIGICLNFYTGLRWNSIPNDTIDILAVGISAIFFVAVTVLFQGPWVFGLCSGLFFLGVFVAFFSLLVLNIHTALAKVLSALLISSAVGLYLSGFELWRRTSHVSKLNQRLLLIGGKNTLPDEELRKRFSRYYDASLFSLVVIVVFSPIIYWVGPFGTLFLPLVALHGAISIVVWSLYGERSYDKARMWYWSKLGFGFGFLAILLIDWWRKYHWEISVIPDMPKIVVEVFLGLSIMYSMGRVGSRIGKLYKNGISRASFYEAFFVDVKNYIYAFAIGLCAFFTILMFLFHDVLVTLKVITPGRTVLVTIIYGLFALGLFGGDVPRYFGASGSE